MKSVTARSIHGFLTYLANPLIWIMEVSTVALPTGEMASRLACEAIETDL